MLSVLVRYGFDDVLQQVGLDRLIDRGKKIVGLRKANAELIRLPQAVRIRKALEELGPTFMKLGQVLSLRPDLVPPDWAEEFRKLQSDTPPVKFDDIKAMLEAEFPDGLDQVFASIDPEPIAAASIAQVHRAELVDGSRVVLKIRRPGIDRVIASDMHLLGMFADFVEEHFADQGYSPREVVHEFSEQIHRELDLRREGRSTDRLNRAFADNDNIRFPKVYWQATTRSVLALEEIQGTLLSHMEPGQFSKEELHALVSNAADAVFRQCLEVGFFHADPHPGNIFAQGDGKLCFIDCGMTGHIDPATAEQLAMLVHGVVTGDIDRVIDVVINLASADPSISLDRAFRADVWEFIAQFDNVKLSQLPIGPLLREFFSKIRKHRLRCPADVVFLIKAITTIESVAAELDPEFNVMEHVRPLMSRLITRRYGLRAMRRRIEHSMLGYAQLAEELPDQIRSLVLAVRRNRLTMNLEHRGLDRLNSEIEHASNNVATALVVAALIVGSSLLVLADNQGQGWGLLSVLAALGYIVAAALAVARTIASRFR